jgi:hypothetical protein
MTLTMAGVGSVALQCCIAGVLIGIPISIKRKSYVPFAVLGVLGAMLA